LIATADVMLFRAKFARGLLSGDYSKSTPQNAENTVSIRAENAVRFHFMPSL